MFQSTTIIIISTISFALGVYAIFFSLSKILMFSKLKRKGKPSVGHVVQVINPEISLLSDISYVPILEFEVGQRPIKGIPYNVVRCNPTFYTEGQTYTIYYDKDNPETFVIDKVTELIATTAILLFGTVLCYKPLEKVILLIGQY